MRNWLSTLVLLGACTAPSPESELTRDTDWRHYGANLASSKYAPLDQIHRGNVTDLQIVWRRPAVTE